MNGNGESNKEVVRMAHMRAYLGDLDLESDTGGKEKWTNSGYILEIESSGLADWLTFEEGMWGCV